MDVSSEIAVVGAGAAGLMAGIQAGRAGCDSVVALDGARKLGAKILVAGGGRCNVTHHAVDESSYAGSSPNAIRKVLRGFGVAETVAFFDELGVGLKREETGKLFPVTDRARTVLDALLGAACDAGVVLNHPWRVEKIEANPGGSFRITGDRGTVTARRIIVATGGRALPKSGSDGGGFRLVESLGHSITDPLTPALVPLVLADDSPLRALSGIACEVELEVRAATGKRLARRRGAALCTHFGLSGPAVMDISRHWIHARHSDPESSLVANFLPGQDRESLDTLLLALGATSPLRFLQNHGLPERLARHLCESTGIDPSAPGHRLTRPHRKALLRTILECLLPVVGDRGYTFAEATAGGVPLRELHLPTMESRITPGLFLCGEILDVDGHIGGFNFQWAWASGFAAGRAAAVAN